MADDTLLVNGDTIAADDIGGIKYQRVKPTHGADGSATDTSSDSPLPVWTPRVVSTSPVLVDAGSILDDLLGENGTPVTWNAAVDASGTGGRSWELKPDTGDYLIIHEILFDVRWPEATPDPVEEFGSAGALANGIEISVRNLATDAEIYELTNDVKITTLADLAALCGHKADVVSNSDSAPNHQAIFKLSLPNPWLIQEPLTSGTYLQVDLNDDLSGLTALYFRVRGYRLDAAAFANQFVHLVN